MTPGDTLPPFTIDRVAPEAMRAWAGFLADPNPIHLDPEAVRKLGLGDRVINQGPANLAYVMNMLMAAFPGGTIETVAARFLDNVYAGDRVQAGGRVTTVETDRITCDVWLEADGRAAVITGSATIRIA
jgi:3-hydroxybutyryl-CoA dehydratase